MFVWLEKALVLATHDRQLAEHGDTLTILWVALIMKAATIMQEREQIH